MWPVLVPPVNVIAVVADGAAGSVLPAAMPYLKPMSASSVSMSANLRISPVGALESSNLL